MFKKTARGKVIRVKVPPRHLPPIGEGGRKKEYSGLNRTRSIACYEPDQLMERTKVIQMFLQQTENHRKKFKKLVDQNMRKKKIKEEKLRSVYNYNTDARTRIL